jgi:hypothetical protein
MLPQDIINIIFDISDVKTKINIKSTCKQLNSMYTYVIKNSLVYDTTGVILYDNKEILNAKIPSRCAYSKLKTIARAYNMITKKNKYNDNDNIISDEEDNDNNDDYSDEEEEIDVGNIEKIIIKAKWNKQLTTYECSLTKQSVRPRYGKSYTQTTIKIYNTKTKHSYDYVSPYSKYTRRTFKVLYNGTYFGKA